jgi:hypothetical protein
MNSFQISPVLGLVTRWGAAIAFAFSGTAIAQTDSSAHLLKPSEALPSTVGPQDAQPGYVAPPTPSAFHTEDSLIIDDAMLNKTDADLEAVVRTVNDHVRFDVTVTGGMGYDSNTLLRPDNEIGAWVSWVSVGASLDVGDESAMGLYYGADLLGNLFQYDSETADGGRNNSEPMLNLYAGVRGAKTNVRVDSMFRINNGNVVDFSDTEREQRRAQSDDFNITLSGQRTLDHSFLTGSYSVDNRDFAERTGLNDTEGMIADAAWFYKPTFTPKTDFGLGLRVGQFNTANNFDQSYIQPSLRTNYTFSRKTQIFSRLGYDLRDIDGAGSIGSTQAFVYELGSRWSPTTRTTMQASLYKDFNPSVVSGFESFNRSGARGSFDYNLPWWLLRFRVEGSYEAADYFSTLRNVASNRSDDYWLFGTSLGRSFSVTRFLVGDVTAFYYYTANDSTIELNRFEDHFTGVRFGLTY